VCKCAGWPSVLISVLRSSQPGLGTVAFPADQSFPARFFVHRLSRFGAGFRPHAFPADRSRSSPVLVFPRAGGLDNDFPHQQQCSGRSHFFSCILCLLRVLLEPRSSVEDFSDPVLVLQFLLWIFLVL
jgi:hypothetical protein